MPLQRLAPPSKAHMRDWGFSQSALLVDILNASDGCLVDNTAVPTVSNTLFFRVCTAVALHGQQHFPILWVASTCMAGF